MCNLPPFSLENSAMYRLRVLWERASTKACLATFLSTLDTYTPVLQPLGECPTVDALRHGTDEAWLSARYSAEDLSNDHELEEAALRLLPRSTSERRSSSEWEDWAGGLDRIAASLSQVQVAKPRLTVAKFGYKGLPVKPDCVEVTCREIFDLLLYEPLEQAFVPSRLPGVGPHPGLVAFYESQLGDAEEPELGQRWFDLCSDHAELEYLSPTAVSSLMLHP